MVRMWPHVLCLVWINDLHGSTSLGVTAKKRKKKVLHSHEFWPSLVFLVLFWFFFFSIFGSKEQKKARKLSRALVHVISPYRFYSHRVILLCSGHRSICSNVPWSWVLLIPLRARLISSPGSYLRNQHIKEAFPFISLDIFGLLIKVCIYFSSVCHHQCLRS